MAAIYSGLGVHGMVIVYYLLTGLLAGFAGCILSSRLGVGSPNVGQGFEFDVVVAVVLGGTSLSGGEGSVFGTFIGALIIGFLGNGLNLLGVQSFYQGLLKGIVLVLAVILDTSIRKKLADMKAG
jgi:ribose/xylose/arabinose/galactoside ABC-type transport system permease subunit